MCLQPSVRCSRYCYWHTPDPGGHCSCMHTYSSWKRTDCGESFAVLRRDASPWGANAVLHPIAFVAGWSDLARHLLPARRTAKRPRLIVNESAVGPSPQPGYGSAPEHWELIGSVNTRPFIAGKLGASTSAGTWRLCSGLIVPMGSECEKPRQPSSLG